MRYFLERLERIPTMLLAALVTVGDFVLFLGVVPLELYFRSIIVHHQNNTAFLLSLLAANVLILFFLFGVIAAAGVVFVRGARRVARVAATVTRQRTR